MEYKLRFINGIECLKMIRGNSRFDKIPIVFYSSHFEKIEPACKNGANYFVIKQAEMKNIKSAIETVLNRNWDDEKIFKKFDVIFREKQNYPNNFFTDLCFHISD
jgi:DNA-binding NarL/FixJ family response regulator